MTSKSLITLCLTLLTLPAATALHAQDVFTSQRGDWRFSRTITVRQDGSGEFRTIQEAIDAAPDFSHVEWTLIDVGEGTYRERVTVPATKERLYIAGAGALKTVISYGNYAEMIYPKSGFKIGTSATATLYVLANNVVLEDLTVENTAGEGKQIGQAVALFTGGDLLCLRRCRFIGNQDTVYTYAHCTAQGVYCRNYFTDCYIEGTTDFIFGPTVAYFENCRIHSKKNSYITAASTYPGQDYGYVFHKCTLTAAEGVDKVYLGRPWRPHARTVFLECEMGGHILPEGWHNWTRPDGRTGEDTSFYAEWGNTGEGARLDGRVGWMHKLSDAEAALHTFEKVMAPAGSAGPGR